MTLIPHIRSGSRSDALSPGLKLGYGMGALVDGVASNVVNTFLLFYLTVACGLNPALAGLILFAGLAFDAIADPFIGLLSDNWRSRLGRRLPFMIAGLVPAALSFVAIFSLPESLKGGGFVAAVCFLSIAMRASVATFNLPYLALGAEISDDYADRSRIVAWRWGLGILGTFCCMALAFGLFLNGPRGLMERSAYSAFAGVSAAMIAAGGVIACLTTYKLRARTHDVVGESLTVDAFLRDVREVFRNTSFQILFSASLLFFTAQTMSGAVNLHAYTFFWRLSPHDVQQVTLAGFIGQMVGTPLVSPLIVRMEKRTAFLIGLVGLILCQTVPATLRLAGGLHMEEGNLALLLQSVALLCGILVSMAVIAFGSMMADAADEHEHLFRKRREGLYFAGWSFSAKAAMGLGSIGAGLALQLIEFPSDVVARGGAQAHLEPGTINGLGLIVGPCAGLFSLLGAAVLIRYRLTRLRHAEMLDDLAARRGEEAPTTAVAGVAA